MPSSMKLRELIRLIRGTKTAADERALISKECALIRTAFKEEDTESRCRNIAKLLYIHMLGYPAHFGQLECIKLIASTRFVDKRIGYLGVSLLLDENSEIGLLVTNCLKNDMASPNQYVVGLALSTMGSISSPEMCRDLATEVEKLLKSSNAFVRKKAALCAVRIVHKVPDLVENFVPGTRALLTEKNHAVLLTGVTLISEMCRVSSETLAHCRKLVPHLVRILKTLTMSGFSEDHNVGGITDPFLQVKILQLLRILGKDDADASEAMSDTLAQIATNTDNNKNVGNALLYENVLVIMDIKSESGLRVLAVNILGRFLGNNDKNIRYVALNTLLKMVHLDAQAVQRHRSTVVECLKDGDVTIRRRAVELIFALVNQSNIRVLMKELLEFLEVVESEFKPFMTTEIFRVAERFSPTRRWHIDTILKVLTTTGSYVQDDAISNFISLVSQSPEYQGYTVQKLYTALMEDIIQQPLVQAGVWCMGEYGETLVSGQPTEEEPPIIVSESEAIHLLESILRSPHSLQITREFAINALVKLSTRFHSVSNRIKDILAFYSRSIDIELQQRSVEYSNMFKFENLRAALLERMPVFVSHIAEPNLYEGKTPDDEMSSSKSPLAGELVGSNLNSNISSPTVALSPAVGSTKATGDSILDLLGDSLSQPAMPVSSNHGGVHDLLDILGGPSQPSQPSASLSSVSPLSGGGASLLDMLDSSSSASSTASSNPALAQVSSSTSSGSGGNIPSITAFEKNGLRVTFDFKRDQSNPHVLLINATSINSTNQTLNDYVFQAAVPKVIKLTMLSPSGSVLQSGGGKINQILQVDNPQQRALRFKIKINFNVNGNPIEIQDEVNNFPPNAL